jgi:hypothetical protein
LNNKKAKSFLAAILVFALLITTISIISAKPNSGNSSLNNTFSIMQISDTQFLAKSYPSLFTETTTWIKNNAAAFNLKMVIHTGDIVDNIGDTAHPELATTDLAQWSNANDAMNVLLSANIPYCWDAGNHDQIPWNGPSGTWSGQSYAAFNVASMQSKPYWIGSFNDGKNTAVMFTCNGYKFLTINLEYKATDATINWMKSLLDSHLDCNVIIAAHSYINYQGGYGTVTGNTLNDAAWCNNLKTILDGYPNVFLTLNGHDPRGYAYSKIAGTREEIYFARHTATTAPIPAAGAATVRIYTFNLATMQVSTTTYAVNTHAWLTTAAYQFTFNVNLKLAITPTGASVTCGGWIVDNAKNADLAINAQCKKDGTINGKMVYNWLQDAYEWNLKTNMWTGLYISSDGSFAVLQGIADIIKTDSTGQVIWSANDYKITVELTDCSSDSVHLRILDNTGSVFHVAGAGSAGELQGGQLTIHL